MSRNKYSIKDLMTAFARDDSGAGTAWALGWLILCFMIAGVAIDVSNGWRVKEFLQATADSTALAGAMEIPRAEETALIASVKAQANLFAKYNMDENRFGDVLLDKDIVVGNWDTATRTFTTYDPTEADPVKPNAVLTVTRQEGGSSTVIGTFFLRFAGFDYFTANAVAIAMVDQLNCFSDGIVAGGTVSLRTQQEFDSYCVHGELGVNLGGTGNPNGTMSGSTWENDSMLSWGEGGYCGQSSSGELCTDEHSPGISDAVSNGGLRSYDDFAIPTAGDISGLINKLATEIPGTDYSGDPTYEPVYAPQNLWDTSYLDVFDEQIFDEFGDPVLDEDDNPTYTTGGLYNGTVALDAGTFHPTELESGYIYTVTCQGNTKSINLGLGQMTEEQQAVVDGNTGGEGSVPLLSGFVLVSENCDFVFDDSVQYTNAAFATGGGGSGRDAIRATSYVRFGSPTSASCADDPIVLISNQSAGFAGGLETRNAQFIINGNMNLASSGNSDNDYENTGSNFWVNGNVYLAADHKFTGCAERYDQNFIEPVMARLVY